MVTATVHTCIVSLRCISKSPAMGLLRYTHKPFYTMYIYVQPCIMYLLLMQVTNNRTVDAEGHKLNLTGTCKDCGGKCTFNAKRCERCAFPKRKPQRKDLQIK